MAFSHLPVGTTNYYGVQPLLPIDEQEYAVASFNLDMDMAQFGCMRCCPGKQPHLREPEFAPAVLDRLGITEEFRKLARDIDEVFHDTGLPPCPCMLSIVLLPCAPMIAMSICKSNRKSQLNDLILNFNQTIAKSRGLYARFDSDFYTFLNGGITEVRRVSGRRRVFQTTNGLYPKLQLMVNVAERREYCTAMGIPDDVPDPQPQVQSVMTNLGMMQVVTPQPGTGPSAVAIPPVMTQPVTGHPQMLPTVMTQPVAGQPGGAIVVSQPNGPGTYPMTVVQSQPGTSAPPPLKSN